jgi:hypothetical protein
MYENGTMKPVKNYFKRLGKGQEAFMMKVGGVAQVAECLLFKG